MSRLHRLLATVTLGAALVLALPAGASAFSTVVIDAGHGGYSLGQSVGGVYEKWLALDIALRLDRYLRWRGVQTVLTRRNDAFVGLDERVNLANRYRRDAIFVSVHFNGSRNTGASGLETFYYSRSGFDLASRIHRRAVPKVRGGNRGVKFGRYHVIRKAALPAALVEGGFLTNPAERARIVKGSYRQNLAEAIGRGILDYQAASR